MTVEQEKAFKRSTAKGKRVSAGRTSKKQFVEEEEPGTFKPYHVLAVPRGPLPSAVKGKPATTAMLRNIPNRYMQSSLLEEINSAGFDDTYDFFYLPMDVRTRANVGYAFINFLDPADLVRFTKMFTDYVFKKHPSMKIAKVSPAHIQGLRENLCHLANRAVTWSWHSQYRPIVKMQGKLKDLAELLTEFPELQAAMENGIAKNSASAAKTAGSFNPEAPEFVPQVPTYSTMNPSAEDPWIVTPHNWTHMLKEEDVTLEVLKEGIRAKLAQEFAPSSLCPFAEEFLPLSEFTPPSASDPAIVRTQELGVRPAPPPGLDDVEVPPGLEDVVMPPAERAEGFKAAKSELEAAVSRWLAQADKDLDLDFEKRLSQKTSLGGSSTRSSCSNSSSRSRDPACV